MEMNLYDDMFRMGKTNVKTLKRPVTLDLDSPDTASKKQKFTILTSPDLNMLKLASPELERLIIANGSLSTTTPTPTQILFPKNVSEEQEDYVKGFVDALNTLHHQSSFVGKVIGEQNNNQENVPTTSAPMMLSNYMPFYLTSPTPTSVIKSSKSNMLTAPNPIIRPPSVENTNSSSCNSNSLPVSLEIAIKEEYQTVPSDFSSPPISPISQTPVDMVDQERIKLERKRYRNRIAASKCRRRKLEKISQLEDKVKDLKGENARLEAFAEKLRQQVCNLKQTVLDHVRKGCQIMIHQSNL